MAERRMISRSISVSEKVNSMSIFARLLYTWMIPHTDDWGRMFGSPSKIKGLVLPLEEEKTKGDCEYALQEMYAAGVIRWYEVDGEMFVQIEKFEKHQQGLHKRTKSKFPDPPDISGNIRHKSDPSYIYTELPGTSENRKEIPVTSGNIKEIPSELNRTELNRTEEKGIEKNKDKTIPPVSPKGEQPDLFPDIKTAGNKAEKLKFAEYVFLTQEQHDKLTEQLGAETRDRYYLEFGAWISGKPGTEQKRRDAYLTILNWSRRDGGKQPARRNNGPPGRQGTQKPGIPIASERSGKQLSDEEMEAIIRKASKWEERRD